MRFIPIDLEEKNVIWITFLGLVDERKEAKT